ncbi:poly-gamma-glutamate synthesis protein (capsule biosynthesis protein) [Methanolinea mesophila]|nr:poly-gamma-glutamate synthesis protein (capsule biosynthesis protein) [Methanolinea mesophila]
MKIRICAVGDIMLGEHPLCINFGVKSSIDRNGFNYLISEIIPTLQNSDFTIGNLETPFIKDPKKRINNYFYSESKNVSTLKENNFNLLSIANNHIMEQGKEGFHDTITALQNYNITPLGLKNQKYIIKKNGLNLAFLAYSLIEDFKDDGLYNKLNSYSQIITDIHEIRPNSDIVIILLHWGDEYVPKPSLSQIEMGRRIINEGADIIIGSHPHVLQGYEEYNDKLIIYSLGNFIFDMKYIKKTLNSAVALIEIDEECNISLKFLPITCNPNDFSLKIANGKEYTQISDSLYKISKFLSNNFFDSKKYQNNYEKNKNKSAFFAKLSMIFHFIKNYTKYPSINRNQIIINFLKKNRCRK